MCRDHQDHLISNFRPNENHIALNIKSHYVNLYSISKDHPPSIGLFRGDSAPAAKPIRHNAGTFSLFKQLNLDAPMSTEEVPALIEKMEGMLEDYKVSETELKRVWCGA